MVVFWALFAKLRKATISFVMCVRLSVRTEQLGTHSTDFHEILYLGISWKSVQKNQVSLKSGKNSLHEDPCQFKIIYRFKFFLELEMFQTIVVEKINTHILCSVTIFLKNRVFYKKMCKNMVQPGRPRMIIWRMRFACRTNNTTHTQNM